MKNEKNEIINENKRAKGADSESIAVRFLKEKGYSIIDQNYHFGSLGEIDIIAFDEVTKTLVFVEVKSRVKNQYGSPEEAITYGKKKQLLKLSNIYFYEKKIKDQPARIDVIAIILSKDEEPIITHYIDAVSFF